MHYLNVHRFLKSRARFLISIRNTFEDRICSGKKTDQSSIMARPLYNNAWSKYLGILRSIPIRFLSLTLLFSLLFLFLFNLLFFLLLFLSLPILLNARLYNFKMASYVCLFRRHFVSVQQTLFGAKQVAAFDVNDA